jgi:hypothetical protein
MHTFLHESNIFMRSFKVRTVSNNTAIRSNKELMSQEMKDPLGNMY